MLVRAAAVLGAALVVAASSSGSTPGARIVFNQNNVSSLDVAAIDADGSVYAELTPGEQTFYSGDQDPSWSPDGSRIVFTSHRDSNVSTEIYVMNAADGSDQRRLTFDGPEGVAPTSAESFDSEPAWSPHGDAIAYLGTVHGADDVWIMSADGSNQRRLTFDGGQKSPPQWSPDGSRLLYSAAGDVTVVPAAGGEPTVLAAGNTPVWSPDGARIALIASGQLWVTSASGDTPPRRLTAMQAGDPSWSPDGSRIAFEGMRVFPQYTSRYGPFTRLDLYTIGADGADLRRLTGPFDEGYSPLPAGLAPAWWPDGSRLFFLSTREHSSPQTYVMNVDGTCQGPFVQSLPELYRPVWRPGSRPGLGPIRCADLRLTAPVPTTATAPAALDATTELRFTLDNDGNETATAVRIEARTAAAARISFASPRSCGKSRRPPVCTLSELPPRGTADIALRVRSAAAGSIPVTVAVTADEPDTDASTNEVASSVQVLPCRTVGTDGPDILRGTSRADSICALPGADRVYGAAGDDYLDAGSGNDVVYGGPGRDTILGKDGNDVIHARDGERDTIDCGHQRDVAYVDRLDVVSHCERVVRR